MMQEKKDQLKTMVDYEDHIPKLLANYSDDEVNVKLNKVANDFVLSTANGGIEPRAKNGYWVFMIDIVAHDEGDPDSMKNEYEFCESKEEADKIFNEHYHPNGQTEETEYWNTVRELLILERPISYEFVSARNKEVLNDQNLTTKRPELQEWIRQTKIDTKISDFKNIDIDREQFRTIDEAISVYTNVLMTKAEKLSEGLTQLLDSKGEIKRDEAVKKIKEIAPDENSMTKKNKLIKTRISATNQLIPAIYYELTNISSFMLPDVLAISQRFMGQNEKRQALNLEKRFTTTSTLEEIVRHMVTHGYTTQIVFDTSNPSGMVNIRSILKYLNSHPKSEKLEIKNCGKLLSEVPPIYDQNTRASHLIPIFQSNLIDAVIFHFDSSTFWNASEGKSNEFLEEGWHIITPQDVVAFLLQTGESF